MNLPVHVARSGPLAAYSPDVNPDEAIRGRVREDVTANTCFGTGAEVQQRVGRPFRDVARRTDEVKRRCRRTLRAQADVLAPSIDAVLRQPDHAVPTVAVALLGRNVYAEDYREAKQSFVEKRKPVFKGR
jgi:hypothetical protein